MEDNYRARREKFFGRFKKEQVLRWMMSFTVTTSVAVTAVVVATTAEPEVSFTNVEVLGNTVYYETLINDPDLTLEEESLVLDVKSGLESFSFPLSLGTSTGTFNIRYFNIDYTLAIKGSQGYGKKTFATYNVISISEPAVKIMDTSYVEDEQALTFTFAIVVFNPDLDLFDIKLFPAFGFSEPGEEGPITELIELPPIDLIEGTNICTLESLPKHASCITLKIAGTKQNEEVILLTESIDLPPTFFTYIHTVAFSMTSLSLAAEVFAPLAFHGSATLNLYQNNELIALCEFAVPYMGADGEYIPPIFDFDNLTENTAYTAQIEVPYLNNIRKKAEVYKSEIYDVYTTPYYTYNIEHILYEYEMVYITLDCVDEGNIISGAYAECFAYDEEGELVPMYITSFERVAGTGGDNNEYECMVFYMEQDIVMINVYLQKAYEYQYENELIYTINI
ncbi:MAG: hypothetical protein BWY30_00672 [Tenericutes bacterium ADurb.Bin239]|nr:MAG: hypothetical protein BWY30_00672 [Tenericutes bacterium ADurb.Bin239]